MSIFTGPDSDLENATEPAARRLLRKSRAPTPSKSGGNPLENAYVLQQARTLSELSSRRL
ncbi:hypothetical protein B0H19DRAFT_1200228 [Mycena capillaripes]|nr:hypothetical protein B0H19DRAFT_1200228 [Mycena capillaripes]